MFDENQLIEVMWSNKTKSHYESFGYHFTKHGDKFYVKAKELPTGSSRKVEVICDYCGEKTYKDYGAYIKSKHEKLDSCIRCKTKKQWDKSKSDRINVYYKTVFDFCLEHDYELLTNKSEIKNLNTVIAYSCKKHGVKTTTIDRIRYGHICLDCSYELRGMNCRHSIDEVKEYIESFNDNKLLNPDDYIGSNISNLMIRCGSCGRVYKVSFSDYRSNEQVRCSVCSKKESKGEYRIRQFLEQNDILFEQEKRFDNCVSKKKLPFDFYLPDYNLIVEFDGEQHYRANTQFGNYEMTSAHDLIKNEYCKNSGIELLRIPYYDYDNIEIILSEKLKIGKRYSLVT